MGKVRTVKVEVPPMSLKLVVPIVSKNEQEKQMPVEDLTWMGCKGMLVESVTKGASKLLRDCRPGNIIKELKKLKQQDKS